MKSHLLSSHRNKLTTEKFLGCFLPSFIVELIIMLAKLSFLILYCFFADAFAQWSYGFGHQQQQQQQAATEFGGFGPWPSKYGLGQQQQQMTGSFGSPIGVYPSWYSPGFSPAIKANGYPVGAGLNRVVAAQLGHPWTGFGGYSAAHPLTTGIGVGGNFGGIGLEGGFGGIGYVPYPLNYGVGAYGYPIDSDFNRMTAASLGSPWTGLGGYSTGYSLEAGLGFGGVGLGAAAFTTGLTGRLAAAQLPYCSEIDRIKAMNGIGAMGTGLFLKLCEEQQNLYRKASSVTFFLFSRLQDKTD